MLDNILDAVRVDFLKDERNVWESITPLLGLKGYEIPIPVMTEVLKDAMRDQRKKPEHPEICEYLLNSPAIVKPRREEEKSYRQLIFNFISALKQSYELINYAEQLAFYFRWNINEFTFSAPPAFQPSEDVLPNNSGNRFRLQNWENNTPLYEHYSQNASLRKISQDRISTLPVVSQGSELKFEPRHPIKMSCSTEEEVTSSTEATLASTEPAINHEDSIPAGRDNNAGNYTGLKITLKENGRTLELAKGETCSLQSVHASVPSSANPPSVSLQQPAAASSFTSDENIPSLHQRNHPLQPDASDRRLGDVKIASPSQQSNISREKSAMPLRKFSDGIRPMPDAPTLLSVPSMKGKLVAKGTVSSTSAEGNNRKNAKAAGLLPKPNILSHLGEKRYGMASKMILNMRTPEEKKVGISVISEFLIKNSHEESVNAFKYLLNAVSGMFLIDSLHFHFTVRLSCIHLISSI